MDRLKSMSILLQVVESGSLSAAARKIGSPLPTVSRKISELEAHLKTQLLNRTTRRLTLTDAGRAYIVACKNILEQVGEAECAATGEYSVPKGDLIVTAPLVFGRLHILPIVAEFLRAYPDIDVQLMLTDRIVNLVEDHVDIGVRIGALPDSSLIATRVGIIRRVVCGSPEYFAARGTPKIPADLSAHDCVTLEGFAGKTEWVFPRGKSPDAVSVHSRLIVTTAEAAVDAAVAGVGITRVLSYQIEAMQQAGKIATVLEKFEPAPWPVSLTYTGGHILPLKQRAFLDFATPRLKARLPQEMDPGFLS